MMRTLTAQEKRTIRLAAIALTIYLTLFYGVRVWKHLEARRAEYQQLLTAAQKIKQEIRPYESKALLIGDLKERSHLNPAKLARTTLVAETSAAIQRAAQTGGVQLGPLRESSSRGSGKELASMQLEATGQVPMLMAFLHKLQTLGYPLIIDSVQITAEPARPGALKLNLTIVILDFDQWKTEEARHA